MKVAIVDRGSCKCVGKHVPLPMAFVNLVEYDVTLCPTSYQNLTRLLRWFKAYGMIPPGYIRKHYSLFVQELAKTVWESNVQ